MEENITDLFSYVFVSRHYPGTPLSVRKKSHKRKTKEDYLQADN
jgi:hypothetical protein